MQKLSQMAVTAIASTVAFKTEQRESKGNDALGISSLMV